MLQERWGFLARENPVEKYKISPCQSFKSMILYRLLRLFGTETEVIQCLSKSMAPWSSG